MGMNKSSPQGPLISPARELAVTKGLKQGFFKCANGERRWPSPGMLALNHARGLTIKNGLQRGFFKSAPMVHGEIQA
jgi:hypothetical protein